MRSQPAQKNKSKKTGLWGRAKRSAQKAYGKTKEAAKKAAKKAQEGVENFKEERKKNLANNARERLDETIAKSKISLAELTQLISQINDDINDAKTLLEGIKENQKCRDFSSAIGRSEKNKALLETKKTELGDAIAAAHAVKDKEALDEVREKNTALKKAKRAADDMRKSVESACPDLHKAIINGKCAILFQNGEQAATASKEQMMAFFAAQSSLDNPILASIAKERSKLRRFDRLQNFKDNLGLDEAQWETYGPIAEYYFYSSSVLLEAAAVVQTINSNSDTWLISAANYLENVGIARGQMHVCHQKLTKSYQEGDIALPDAHFFDVALTGKDVGLIDILLQCPVSDDDLKRYFSAVFLVQDNKFAAEATAREERSALAARQKTEPRLAAEREQEKIRQEAQAQAELHGLQGQLSELYSRVEALEEHLQQEYRLERPTLNASFTLGETTTLQGQIEIAQDEIRQLTDFIPHLEAAQERQKAAEKVKVEEQDRQKAAQEARQHLEQQQRRELKALKEIVNQLKQNLTEAELPSEPALTGVVTSDWRGITHESKITATQGKIDQQIAYIALLEQARAQKAERQQREEQARAQKAAEEQEQREPQESPPASAAPVVGVTPQEQAISSAAQQAQPAVTRAAVAPAPTTAVAQEQEPPPASVVGVTPQEQAISSAAQQAQPAVTRAAVAPAPTTAAAQEQESPPASAAAPRPAPAPKKRWQNLKKKWRALKAKWKALPLKWKIVAALLIVLSIAAGVVAAVFCPPSLMVTLPVAGKVAASTLIEVGAGAVLLSTAAGHSIHVARTTVKKKTATSFKFAAKPPSAAEETGVATQQQRPPSVPAPAAPTVATTTQPQPSEPAPREPAAVSAPAARRAGLFSCWSSNVRRRTPAANVEMNVRNKEQPPPTPPTRAASFTG